MKYEEIKLSKPVLELCNSYNIVIETYENMYLEYYKMYKLKNILLYPFKKNYKEKLDYLDKKIFDSYNNLGKMIDSI